LHKVTIIPRGPSLGSTMSLPKEDILNYQRRELEDMIAMTMAGRIAEQIVSGDVSTGAGGDIQQATNMARAMVCQYGMSDKLGMVQYTEDDEYFLGRDMMRRKSYSEATAQEIDSEVRSIIKAQFERAHGIIHDNRDKLEIIANSLLEYETLDGAQVEEIVRTGKFTPPPQPPHDVEPPMGAQAATPLPEVMKPATPKLPGLGDAAPAPA
jgi:cell division protease FtsH